MSAPEVDPASPAEFDADAQHRANDRFFGTSGFNNLGLWTETTVSAAEAGHNLVQKVLGLCPREGGRVLDVGASPGSARLIAERFGAGNVTAINLDPALVKAVGDAVPGVESIQMNATSMTFPASTFDTIVCVESACHFKTRVSFLREALRLLKPGGSLVMSDFTCADVVGGELPRANRVNADAYRELVEALGFVNVGFEVDVGLEKSWKGFRRFARALAFRDMCHSAMKERYEPADMAVFAGSPLLEGWISLVDAQFVDYVFVSAVKAS